MPPAPKSKAPERQWRGCVQVLEPGGLVRWAKVVIPESVVQAHAVAVFTPDLRSRVSGLIENEMLSEHIVTGRGWVKP